MRSTVKKWGNSAAIRLPSSMMKTLKIDIDDTVELRVERGRIVIEPVQTEQYLLSQLLGSIKAQNVHAEIDFGAAG